MELVSGKVMVFGTFDVLHEGHKYFIVEAMKKSKVQSSKLKNDFVIVVARDETVRRIKPNLKNSEVYRMKKLQESFPELTIVLGDKEDYMLPIRKYRPELVCLGYDQDGFSEQLIKDFPEIRIERIKAYKPEKYKSSKL